MTDAESRRLDPSERYFLLLDRLWPVNVVSWAELDRAPDPEEVRAVWTLMCRRYAGARSRLADAGGEANLAAPAEPVVDFALASGPRADLVEHEQLHRFDLTAGPLMRCRYLAEPAAGERPSIMLVGSHAVIDGRGSFGMLQTFVRRLADPHAPVPAYSLPPAMHQRIVPERQWRANRGAYLALLRTLREEREGSPQPGPWPWPLRPADPRGSRTRLFDYDTDQLTALRLRARAAGATIHGALAALWLRAVREAFPDPQASYPLGLTSPIDLRERITPPLEPTAPGMYTSMVTSTHEVGGPDWRPLAHDVSTQVHRRVGRGEGELFFELVRPEAFPLVGSDVAPLARMIDGAQPVIGVSNVGAISAEGDPAWLRRLCVLLPPTPNQAVFVAMYSYRGRLVCSVGTDPQRLPADVEERVVRAGLAGLAQLTADGAAAT